MNDYIFNKLAFNARYSDHNERRANVRLALSAAPPLLTYFAGAAVARHLSFRERGFETISHHISVKIGDDYRR
jgi:hypothetical protein